MSETKVVTGIVRFSYAHVFEAHKSNENSDPKYSVSLIIPKSDKKTVKKIQDAVQAALQEGKAKFGGTIPKKWKNPLRDGDEEKEDDENYADSYYINANSSNKPSVVDKNCDPILDKDEFYSGCYGRASVNFYAFNFEGTKGIACGLNHVQKLKDGDRLGAAISTAEEDFGKVDDEDLM